MTRNYIEMSADLPFLIVDPSPNFREGLIHCLKQLGYRVFFQSTDGSSALENLKNHKIGFVICERNLGKVSGMELLKEIRERIDIPRSPFMMMATDTSKEDIMLAAEFGIDDYLKKPFVIKDVSARVSTCMSRYNDPTSTEAQFDTARVFCVEAKFEEAIAVYGNIKKQLPNSARVRVGLARCYRAKNQPQEAETLLNEAIELNPMYVHAFHELGLICLAQQRLEEALDAFDKAISISPGNPIRYESISDILLQEGKFSEAEEYLTRAVKLELVYPALYEQLGKALFSQKKPEKAALYFIKALEKDPKNISFLNSMGICMKDLGKFDDSLNYYNMALKQNPENTRILFNKALCFVTMKSFDRAIKILDKILELDPAHSKAAQKKIDIKKLEAEQKAPLKKSS